MVSSQDEELRWIEPEAACPAEAGGTAFTSGQRESWRQAGFALVDGLLPDDLINEAGISGMRFSISETAKWGDVKIGPKIIDVSVKKRMKEALKDIQSGKFAKAWVREYKGGYKQYNKLLKAGEKHNIEKVGTRLRSMMPWMRKRTVKGAQAAY